MATIEDLTGWIEHDFGRRGSAENKVQDVTEEWLADHPIEHPYLRIKIYTFTNCYTISATENPDGGYLGCTAEARKPRAGEDWNRGNDLPDGKLIKKTWNNILCGIVNYELEDVSKYVKKRFQFEAGSMDVEIEENTIKELEAMGIDVWAEAEEGLRRASKSS